MKRKLEQRKVGSEGKGTKINFVRGGEDGLSREQRNEYTIYIYTYVVTRH
jgi:hypothetical protein